MMEDHVAGSMAGTMADLELQFADAHLITIQEPARGLERSAGDSISCAILGQTLDPEAILLIGSFYRDAELLGKDSGTSAMVYVAVGEEDLLDRHARLICRGPQSRQVAAGIDEGSLHRFGAPQQGAILLER